MQIPRFRGRTHPEVRLKLEKFCAAAGEVCSAICAVNANIQQFVLSMWINCGVPGTGDYITLVS